MAPLAAAPALEIVLDWLSDMGEYTKSARRGVNPRSMNSRYWLHVWEIIYDVAEDYGRLKGVSRRLALPALQWRRNLHWQYSVCFDNACIARDWEELIAVEQGC